MTFDETRSSTWTSNEDPYEVAMDRARALQAMLLMTVGEGGGAFRCMNDTLQEDYLAAAQELSDQLCHALSALPVYDKLKAAKAA